MDLLLQGRAVAVTGGSAGIGRAVTLGLLAEGAWVGVCARRRDKLDSLMAEAGDHADRLYITTADVRDDAQVGAFIDGTASQFGGLDGLVANAGTGTGGNLFDSPLDTFTTQMDIKVNAGLRTIRAALPHLRQSDAARIVVINSITAHAPERQMAAVGAARAALSNAAALMATELAPEGICVNRVNLGPIVTEQQRVNHAASGSAKTYENWLIDNAKQRGIPVGRMGTPAEVVPWVLLLLSPLAGFTTGADISVAGGMGIRV